ncbi:MAG: GYD domain-containing protein [Acidimicrobiia bacterium]
MAKYLFKGSLSHEGVEGLLKEGGVARREVVSKALQSVGGSLESFYFAFGASDVFAIAELPDNETAAAFALAVGSSGRISVETVVLVTPEMIDAARSKNVAFRPPGG